MCTHTIVLPCSAVTLLIETLSKCIHTPILCYRYTCICNLDVDNLTAICCVVVMVTMDAVTVKDIVVGYEDLLVLDY